ncbi:MAG: sensor histidine kinase [bacterium]
MMSEVQPKSRARTAAILIALWSVPGFMAGVETYVFQGIEGRHPQFWRVLLIQCTGWWAWALMTPVVFSMARRWPVRRPISVSTVGVHVSAAIAAAVVHAFVYTAGGFALAQTPPPSPFISLVAHSLLGWFPLSILIYVGLVSGGHWLELARREHEREQRTLALEAQLAGAQLQALRMQLHPHFLFNTLNTIAMLVREQDVTASVRLISQLGDVLRQVLRSAETQEVALAEEIEFTRKYLEIEEVRFADRLRVEWNLDDDALSAVVPHLILQPLVENALRHGIARREESGLLQIAARRAGDRLVLSVRDDGPGLGAMGEASDGIGLANVRARLVALYRERGALVLESLPLDDGGGVRATITLPWRVALASKAIAAELASADV